MENQDEESIQFTASSLKALAACPERYEVKALVGQGGMGMVFRGYDLQLNRDVAIKVLLFEGASVQELQERFLREAKALAVLDHPNIVRIFSSGLNRQGNPYNVMEYLEGESLSLELSRGALKAESFYDVISQVLAGLEHAHRQQIVHRDLKPSNIMHCKTVDGDPIYKIIDFGIARIDLSPERAGRTLTRTDTILGSPIYISPEQCRGERGDYRCDVYSLGCMMYECISGKPPFQGETSFETMYKHMTETPINLACKTKSARSKQLADLIASCLEKKTEDRPQISEIAAEIKQIFGADLDEIDLFANRGAGGNMNSRIKIAVAIVAILLPTIAISSWFYLQSRSANAPSFKVSTKEDLRAREIGRLKARVTKWANPATITDLTKRDRYLDDLFALGRVQLQSSLKQENSYAEKTYTDALKFCDRVGAAPRRRAACFALRAKAGWKQGKFSDSETDFEQAIKLVKDNKDDQSVYHDVLLERTQLWIHSRKYAKAWDDYDAASKTIGISLFNMFQTLDPPGDNRAAMISNTAAELRKMEPQSELEAVQMLKLSNRIGNLLSRMSTRRKEAELILRFSLSLLPKIHGDEVLKANTRTLVSEHFDSWEPQKKLRR